MKLITFEDISRDLTFRLRHIHEWTVEMIKNKADSILPPKISLKPYDVVCFAT